MEKKTNINKYGGKKIKICEIDLILFKSAQAAKIQTEHYANRYKSTRDPKDQQEFTNYFCAWKYWSELLNQRRMDRYEPIFQYKDF